ncbi:MAG TPA: class I SAM-dependent methyltransferase [Thermotogota bacterium]|nr:class I SAM-dependent methyltransferase [Thermotogota bacterium]
MDNEKTRDWIKLYSEEMPWPSEYVIRIFRGKFPKLRVPEMLKKGSTVLDIGCGSGRNMPLLYSLGYKPYGVEINQKLVDLINSNMAQLGINGIKTKVGYNDAIPYPGESFDCILSWNSCYYLRENVKFSDHVNEFNRVLKKNGLLILSIPKKTCFIYKGSKLRFKGYYEIKNDPFMERNGMILRRFANIEDVKESFSPFFSEFIVGSIFDDCFGWDYHWHLVVCRKKE